MEKEKTKSYDISFKVIFLGDSGVGKSSIIKRYTENTFDMNTEPTLGEIWDTAGQERFRNIAPLYYRKANAIIIVYDITNKNSFESIKFWLNEIQSNGNPHCYITIIGNKYDLNENRYVSFEQGSKFAQENEIFHMEVSAKDNVNISKLFRRIGIILFIINS